MHTMPLLLLLLQQSNLSDAAEQKCFLALYFDEVLVEFKRHDHARIGGPPARTRNW